MTVKVEIADLGLTMREIRRLSPEMAKKTRNRVRAAAKEISDDARRRAPVRSGRLRRSVRPRVYSNGRAAIVASAPHARIVEFGGRHPVFGKDRWVPQPETPFMREAVRAGRANFFRMVDAAVSDAVREVGFT